MHGNFRCEVSCDFLPVGSAGRRRAVLDKPEKILLILRIPWTRQAIVKFA